ALLPGSCECDRASMPISTASAAMNEAATSHSHGGLAIAQHTPPTSGSAIKTRPRQSAGLLVGAGAGSVTVAFCLIPPRRRAEASQRPGRPSASNRLSDHRRRPQPRNLFNPEPERLAQHLIGVFAE